MRRILHIYKNFHPIVGGIENHVKVLAEAEALRGDDVTVLVANAHAHTERKHLNGVHVIKAARNIEFASTPLSAAMLWVAWRLEADIVNLHVPYPPGDLVARAVRASPTLVVSYHSDVVRQRHLLKLYRPLLKRTLASAERIIVASQNYRDTSPFLRPHARKCRIVPYSVDGPRFAAGDPHRIERPRVTGQGPVILSVGVLRYYKGLHILLEAARRLEATIMIVGAGPEEGRLRHQAARAGLADRVHFVGRVPDELLPDYYQAADVFVLASQLRAEAFGIVLLEAMAAGLPLVTTDLGTGTSEINRHGETGFVVPPNDPAALARALKVLLANPELREHFGRQGQRKVMLEYRPADLASRTAAVYDEALYGRTA